MRTWDEIHKKICEINDRKSKAKQGCDFALVNICDAQKGILLWVLSNDVDEVVRKRSIKK